MSIFLSFACTSRMFIFPPPKKKKRYALIAQGSISAIPKNPLDSDGASPSSPKMAREKCLKKDSRTLNKHISHHLLVSSQPEMPPPKRRLVDLFWKSILEKNPQTKQETNRPKKWDPANKTSNVGPNLGSSQPKVSPIARTPDPNARLKRSMAFKSSPNFTYRRGLAGSSLGWLPPFV